MATLVASVLLLSSAAPTIAALPYASDINAMKPPADDSMALADNGVVNYTDLRYGYSLTVPASWTWIETPLGGIGGTAVFASYDVHTAPGVGGIPTGHAKVDISIVSTTFATGDDMRDYVRRLDQQSEDLGARILSQSAGSAAGTQVLRLEHAQLGNTTDPVDVEAWYVAQKNLIYKLTLYSSGRLAKPQTHAIAQSFRPSRDSVSATQAFDHRFVTPSRLSSLAPGGQMNDTAPAGYRLPFDGTCTITAGPRCYYTHRCPGYCASSEAMDFARNKQTFPVITTQAGTVVYSADGSTGFGNYIRIQHADGNVSYYAHLSERHVQLNDEVVANQQIGISGTTGHSTGIHLHFEVRNPSGQSIWMRDLPVITWFVGTIDPCCMPEGQNDGSATYVALAEPEPEITPEPGTTPDPGVPGVAAALNQSSLVEPIVEGEATALRFCLRNRTSDTIDLFQAGLALAGESCLQCIWATSFQVISGNQSVPPGGEACLRTVDAYSLGGGGAFSVYRDGFLITQEPGVPYRNYIGSCGGGGVLDGHLLQQLCFPNEAPRGPQQAASDLSISKTCEPAAFVYAGNMVACALLVENYGPDASPGHTVVDTLPEGIEFAGGSAECADSGGSVVCTGSELAANAAVEYVILGRVKASAVVGEPEGGAVVVNGAEVGPLEDDIAPDNNVSEAAIAIQDSADLRIWKVGKPDEIVRAGGTLRYTIFVDNFGPSDARNVVVTDDILNSPGETYTIVSGPDPSQGSCDSAAPGEPILCDLGPLGALGRATIQIEVEASETQDVNNLVRVVSDTPDPDVSNNMDAVMTSVEDVADLVITKAASASPWLAGSADVEYVLTVRNDGPSSAENVVVVDRVPEDLTLVPGSLSSSQGACGFTPSEEQPVELRCFLGTLGAAPPTNTANIRFRVSIPSDYPVEALTGNGRVVNEAEVSSDILDPNNANNLASVLNDVEGRIADLRVTKFGKPDGEVRAGTNLVYTVIVDNLGPSVARNVVLTDLLQSDGTFRLVSVVSDRAAECSLTSGTFNQRMPLTCQLSGNLEAVRPGQSGRWIITVTVTADQTQDINNVARVESSNYDPDLTNNHAHVEHDITDVADLSVVKTAVGEVQVSGQRGLVFNVTSPGAFPPTANYNPSLDQVTAGRRIRYTLNVANSGPSIATNVVLVDRLPAGVTLVPGTLTASQGTCRTGTPGLVEDQLTCGLGTILAPSGTAQVTFDVLVDPGIEPGTVLENDAFVYSEIYDPSNANNYDFTQTTVNTWADMSIAKSSVGDNIIGYDASLRRFVHRDLPSVVTAGQELRYEISVQNNGPSDAVNVQVLDVLPDLFGSNQHYAVTFERAVGAVCRPDDEHALWSILWGPIGSAAGQAIVCDLGTVAAGARRTFDVYVTVDPSVAQATVIDNGALVLYGASSPPAQPPSLFPGSPQIPTTLPYTNDPFTNDNFVVQNTTVNAVADVWVTKEDVPAESRLDMPEEPDQAIAGRNHRYLIEFGNDGPSVALNVGVTDLLDLKQPGILGERFVRCEPVDPDDAVVCTFTAPNTVTLTSLKHGNDVVITSGTGSLSPGEKHSFYLITTVDEGYVLDATDFIAENLARINTTTTDYHGGPCSGSLCVTPANNQDTEQTLTIAEADLELVKVDDAAGFLTCDPVGRGGTVTYDLTVTNHGPSDAASVYLIDQLPDGLVLDPDEVTVTVDGDRGSVESVQDDGRIQVRIGRDPSNTNVNQLGRINAPGPQYVGPVTVRITARVAEAAACGGVVRNVASVATGRDAVTWPDAVGPAEGLGGGPRTPTLDPETTNNVSFAETTVECPAITVKKTVSFDGTCPGQDLPSVWNETAQPVTFCYEITNSGTTYLDVIYVEDRITSRTRPEPTVIFTDTIRYGADERMPIAPGETVLRQVTTAHLLMDRAQDCGKVTDTVVVTANPVNSGRTDLPCLPDVTGQDSALIEVPCAGVDFRLQLPVVGGDDCETWIQVQNVGDRNTQAMLVFWGEPGFCPPQAAGPLKSECGGLLRPGSAWSFAAGQIPQGARSAVVYSLSTDTILVDGVPMTFAEAVCNRFYFAGVGDYYDWALFDSAYRNGVPWEGLDLGLYRGEPVAAVVNRACPDPTDPNVTVNAAYTGISSDMEGAYDPNYGGYTYFAPAVFADQNGLKSVLQIQNSGTTCTSLEIWFKDQENCLRNILADVLTVAPGETVSFDSTTVLGQGWTGSAWVRASQPLGVVVDTFGPNHFTSYVGVAGDVWDLDWSFGNQVSYLPLTYSEYQGWDTAIQVQNLSATYSAKVKVYFLDRSGDVIATLLDWICPRGSQTFFLPLVDNIPGSWVGSARVESQEWVTPGGPLVDPPRIHAVALMEKWADPQRTARREAIAYNGHSECLLFDWQLGDGKGGTASGSAVMAVPLVAKEYERITTELAITNLVPKPGFTDFAVFLYDQNGLLDYVCQKLNEKQVEYIDLATWGSISSRFMGSAVVSAMFWEHDVFDGAGGFQRNIVGLGGVAVERIGGTLGGPDVPGDESKAFEMFPVYDHFGPARAVECPGVPTGFSGR